jgi:hypothetical protein
MWQREQGWGVEGPRGPSVCKAGHTGAPRDTLKAWLTPHPSPSLVLTTRAWLPHLLAATRRSGGHQASASVGVARGAGTGGVCAEATTLHPAALACWAHGDIARGTPASSYQGAWTSQAGRKQEGEHECLGHTPVTSLSPASVRSGLPRLPSSSATSLPAQ